jgi:hypothetical protein
MLESVKEEMMGEMYILVGSQKADVIVVPKVMEGGTEFLKSA